MKQSHSLWCLCLCFVLGPLACLAQQKTLISDTLLAADGSKAQGTATIKWLAFTSADGIPIAQGTRDITIANGVVAIQLVPTQGATPAGTAYTVTYFLHNSPSYTESWTVPIVGPVTLARVRAPDTTSGNGNTLVIANGLAGNNLGDRAAIKWSVTTDGTTSPPNFSNQEGLFLNMVSTNGQNDSDQSAKKTFYGILNRDTHYGAGQRFSQGNQLTCYGMGDCLETADAVTMLGGVNASGDEGTAFRSMTLQQGGQLSVAKITSNSPQTTCKTTITRAIRKNIAPQPVTVASTTGCRPGDWVVLGEGALFISDTKIEAVQLSAVSPGVITAVFVKDHPNGDTISPATRLTVSDTGQMGQLRYLVNLSQPAYAAGKVSGIRGRTFTGSGTNWTRSMVGGNSNIPGCVSMPADDYTARPFSASNPLRSWYPIQTVDSATSLTIEHLSVIGGVGYSGHGPGQGAYTARPCARILSFAFSSTSVGNTLILENNSFTWNVGDTVEAAYSVDGDVAGEDMRVGWYMPGANLRSIYSAVNIGAQPFNSAFSSGSQMTVPNTTAFLSGVSLASQMQTGISMGGRTTSGIGISMANYPGDNKAIQWSNAAIYQDAGSGDMVLTRGIHDVTQPTFTLARSSNTPPSADIFGSLQVSFNDNPRIRLQNTFGGGAGVGYEFRNLQQGSFFRQPGLEVYADAIRRSFLGIFPGFGLMAINSSGPASAARNTPSYSQSFAFETFNGTSSDVRYVHSMAVPGNGVIAVSKVAPVEWRLGTNMGPPNLDTMFAGISNTGTLRFGNPAQGMLSLNASAITESRVLTAPDKSGMIALATKPGTSGTAPNWTATGDLNIPMAASSGTTAGLLSHADYQTLSEKTARTIFVAALPASQIAASAAIYFFAAGSASAEEAAGQIPIPAPTVARGISCFLSGAQPGTGTLVVTLRRNGATPSGGLVVTIPASSAAGVYADNAHSVAFNAGDLIDLQVVNRAASPSGRFNGCSLVMQ